jgi:hypothetical protein
VTRYLGALEKARIIDAALRLANVVEKSAAALRKSGADDEADTAMFSMMDLLSDLKGMFANPDGTTMEEIRRAAAKVDGLIQQFSRPGRTARTPVVSRSAEADDVEDEDAKVEEDDNDGDIQKAVRRRLRGEISEDSLMKILGFEVK